MESMSNTNTGGQAFPRPGDFNPQQGMTLRDYFAAKAMASVIARGDDTNRPGMAEWSYAMADAMLAARSNT
jgi:hypothetical protein